MTTSWQQILDAARALRHDLHSRPELTGREMETAAAIRAALSRAGIDWRVCAETGTVAVLAKEAPGRNVALRADMDALPIEEQTLAPWASKNPGCMHACGHDGHIATLMAAGIWLKHQESQLPGPVTVIFQPAEEGGHGARRMIEDGALAGVDVIYAWHNWPAMPFGRAVCPDGPVMAANGTFKITVTGEGGHASQPELCRDPVAAASAIVLALQQIVSRRLPPQAAAVVSVTCFEAPGSETVIPMQAVLTGNIRISEDGLRNRVNDLIGPDCQGYGECLGRLRGCGKFFPRYGAHGQSSGLRTGHAKMPWPSNSEVNGKVGKMPVPGDGK